MRLFRKTREPETRKPPVAAPAVSIEASDAAHLRPQLTTLPSLDDLRLRRKLDGGEALTVPHRILGGDLVLSLVVEKPPAPVLVDDEALHRLRLDVDQAFDLATSQLMGEPAPGPGIRWDDDRLVATAQGEDFAGIRLLLSAADLDELGADRIMIPVSTDLVVMGDVGRPESVAAALEQALTASWQGDALTYTALSGNGDRWQRLHLSPTHPAHELWRGALAVDHALQAEKNRATASTLNPDAVVEAVDSIVDRHGRVRSAIHWHQGRISLLSETDVVVFVPQEDEQTTLVAPWPRVVEHLGVLMAPTGTNPERWRVRTYPDAEKFRAMGAQPMGN